MLVRFAFRMPADHLFDRAKRFAHFDERVEPRRHERLGQRADANRPYLPDERDQQKQRHADCPGLDPRKRFAAPRKRDDRRNRRKHHLGSEPDRQRHEREADERDDGARAVPARLAGDGHDDAARERW